MADIGKYNTLTVLEKSNHGLYLDVGTITYMLQ